MSLSGPAALLGLRFLSSFKIPATEISKFSITRVEFSVPSGIGSESVSPLSAMSWSFMVQSGQGEGCFGRKDILELGIVYGRFFFGVSNQSIVLFEREGGRGGGGTAKLILLRTLQKGK